MENQRDLWVFIDSRGDRAFPWLSIALIMGNEGLGDDASPLLRPTRTYLVEQSDRRFYEEGFL